MDHLPKRPDMQSPFVLHAFAKAVFPSISAWREKSAATPMTDADVLADLNECLTAHTDGFSRASYLQVERGWSPNQDLVSLLSHTWSTHISACRQKQAEWAMLHGVRFHGKQGETVSFKRSGDPAYYAGTVVALFSGEARALVSVNLRGAIPIAPPVIEEVFAEQVTHVKAGDTAASRTQPVRDFVGFQAQQQLQVPVNRITFIEEA